MNKKFFLSLLLSCMGALSSFAETGIYASAAKAVVGRQVTLSIQMDAANVSAYEFTLILPDGITLAENGIVKTTTRVENLPEGQTLVFGSRRGETSTRVFGAVTPSSATTGNLGTYSGSTGEIATVKLNIAADVALGNHNITISDVVLAGPDSKAVACAASQTTTIKVVPVGDTNGDGKLSNTDLNRLMGQVRKKQFDTLCDINGDGKISNTDINYLLKLIRNK